MDFFGGGADDEDDPVDFSFELTSNSIGIEKKKDENEEDIENKEDDEDQLIVGETEFDDKHEKGSTNSVVKERNKKAGQKQRKLDEAGLPIRNRKKIKRPVKTFGLGTTKAGTVRLKSKAYREVPGTLWSKIERFTRGPGEPIPKGLPPSPANSVWIKKRGGPIKINTVLYRDRDTAAALVSAAKVAKLGDLAGFGGIMTDGSDLGDVGPMAMEGPTNAVDDMFNTNYDGVFGDAADYGPGDLSMFGEGALTAAMHGTADNIGDRSQFDMMLDGTATTVSDDFSGSHRSAYAAAYKWTPKTIYSLTDDRAFYDAMRLCGTDLFLISAHLRGWTYDQVKRKYNTEIKRNPGLAKEILTNSIPFSTRPWQDTHRRKIDPSKHFRPEVG